MNSEVFFSSEIKTRVLKKFTLYIPKAIAEAIGLREGTIVRLRAEGSRIIIEPIPDPFDYALKGPKYARIKFEDFERD